MESGRPSRARTHTPIFPKKRTWVVASSLRAFLPKENESNNIRPTVHSMVASARPEEIPSETAAEIMLDNDEDSRQRSLYGRYMSELGAFLAFALALAMATIAWEDLTCSHVLPSRATLTFVVNQRQQYPSSSSTGSSSTAKPSSWGASTVHGMGFGWSERQVVLLQQQSSSFSNDDDTNNDSTSGGDVDPLAQIPSYNEVLLRHRTETLPQWKESPTLASTQAAIHNVLSSLQTIERLQIMANDYKWDAIRTALHDAPMADLPQAASVLRQIHPKQHFSSMSNTGQSLSEVVGFDWGSCAWRHCGALADTQEALDELEQLLGVLEPFEAVFCLDIVERSLRDILMAVPWLEAAPADAKAYATLPAYVSKIAIETENDNDDATSRIDAAYFKALQELRID